MNRSLPKIQILRLLKVEADHQKQLAAKQPFSGQGFKLGDPTPAGFSSTLTFLFTAEGYGQVFFMLLL